MNIAKQFFIILLFSALCLSAMLSGINAEQTPIPVAEKEDDSDIKIDFDIFKKVGRNGRYIVPRIGFDSSIPSMEIPRTLPPNTTPIATTPIVPPAPPDVHDKNPPSLPVIIPRVATNSMPSNLPSIPAPVSEHGSGIPIQRLPSGAQPSDLPGAPSTKSPGENLFPDTLPGPIITTEEPTETTIHVEVPSIPDPGSIYLKDSELGTLHIPSLTPEISPLNKASEISSGDIPSIPQVNEGKNLTDLNLPQKLQVEEVTPSPKIQLEYPIPSLSEIDRPIIDLNLKVPDIPKEEVSSPAPYVEDNLPVAPDVVDSESFDLPKGDISILPSLDDQDDIPGMRDITNVPIVETPAVGDAKIPDQVPSLGKPVQESSEDIPRSNMPTSEIQYKIIREWKKRNLLYDGDFEAVPHLEKDAWFAENCIVKRELKLTGAITLPPKSGIQLAVVYGKQEGKITLYQMVNVESLAELIDKGKITLKASVFISSLSDKIDKARLTVLCWGYVNEEGKLLQKKSHVIPVTKGVWETGDIHLGKIPASTKLIQFHISFNNFQGISEPMLALDRASLILMIR